MKVRFELEREGHEDIIIFDFSRLIRWRGYNDTKLNELINPKELYAIAQDIITNPLSHWEYYSETSDYGEPICVYPYKGQCLLFSIPYFREWKNGDRKYHIFIEGTNEHTPSEICYAKDLAR